LGRPLEVVIVLVGTEDDPQGMGKQRERLAAAGAILFEDVGAAVNYLARRLSTAAGDGDGVSLAAFRRPVAAINVGLESFAASLAGQGAAVIQVDWRPPAGGNEALMDVLARMRTGQRP
jgi:FdrA protein